VIVSIAYGVNFKLYPFFRVRFEIEATLENNVAFALLLPTLEQMNVFSVEVFQLEPISQPSFRDMGLVDEVYGLVQGFKPLLFEGQEIGI
jgi:hypothetical protein